MALQTEESRNASINARLNAMRGGGNGASISIRRRDIVQGTQPTDVASGHPTDPAVRNNQANALFRRHMESNGIDTSNSNASNAVNFSQIYLREMDNWRQQYTQDPHTAERQLSTICEFLRRHFV
jgi:hypothetical protein